ncbi:MAG: hypothetical protein EBT56_16015 [Betaproteobacteria bacterium]|nr:hypothetical protein [Betaproteobacteria bacterium]
MLLERLPERYVLQVQQRPRYACRCCKAMAQADAPSRPLVRSYAGAGLLAQIMVSKYQDSLPLYRQGQMLAREGIHIPQTTLADWVGGVEAGCWAHARRGFMQIHSTSPSAMTTEVLAQIQALYRIERHLRGRPPDERRQSRQVQSAPILEQLRARLLKGLSEVSQRSATAKAIGYVLNQWEALGVFVHDGRVEIDNNIAENAIRTVAIGRKNYLFLGSDEGGDRAATLYSLLGTASTPYCLGV